MNIVKEFLIWLKFLPSVASKIFNKNLVYGFDEFRIYDQFISWGKLGSNQMIYLSGTFLLLGQHAHILYLSSSMCILQLMACQMDARVLQSISVVENESFRSYMLLKSCQAIQYLVHTPNFTRHTSKLGIPSHRKR